MRISVVIPVYNSAESLRRQLEALSNQSTSIEFEVIVSDNNSRDNLDEVVKSFDDVLNIRTVKASAVQGQSYARNYAVSESNAEFILFCDADDLVSPNWVNSHCRQFEELKADITTGPAYDFYSYDDLDNYNIAVDSDASAGDIVIPDGKKLIPVIGCNFGVKRAKFVAVGGFDQSMRGGGEDIDLGIRIQLSGAVVSSSRSAYIFKKERSSMKSIAKQSFYYNKQNVLLVDRYGEMSPVSYSLRYSVSHIIKDIVALLLHDFYSRAKRGRVYQIGGNFGTVDGYVEYKIFKKSPAPQLFSYQG